MRITGVTLVTLVGLAGCGDDLGTPWSQLVKVSGLSPFGAGCGGAGQSGQNHAAAEVEPSLAIDPTDTHHLIGAWQQDRWSSGGSNGLVSATSTDGGLTWTASMARFSRCAGGDDYERASDPWVTIGPDGVAWEMALVFDNTNPARSGMRAARSRDGGATWDDPVTLIADDDLDVFNDKNAITADPAMPGRVYAVWDRLTGQLMPKMPIGTGPTMFARTTDGAWELPARPVFDPGIDAQTIGNVIVVEPDGALVDVFDLITHASSDRPISAIAAVRSTDHGDTWSATPAIVAFMMGIGIHDVAEDVFVRSGSILPQVAVDRHGGALYVVWEDARFSNGETQGIALSVSTDGGVTWTQPAQINQDPEVDAFDPVVAVADNGTVAVTYYDRREQDPSPDQMSNTFVVTSWMIRSYDGGATWAEEPVSGPFDLRAAQVGGVYFLGDYQGLVASGVQFIPFFGVSDVGADDPTDIMVRPLE